MIDGVFKTPVLDTQPNLVKLSRYRSLNLVANMMNYYASKVDNSYKITKDDISRLTAVFEEAFHNGTNQSKDEVMTSDGYLHKTTS